MLNLFTLIFVAIFVFIFLAIFFIKKFFQIKKKKIQEEIDKLEIQRNSLVVSNIENYLSKIRSFEQVERITINYKNYLSRWQEIIDFLEKKVSDKLIELNDLKDTYKFSLFKEKKINMQNILKDQEKKISKLENEISTFIHKEEKMQKKFENAKEELKKIAQLFYANRESLHPYDERLEKIIENLEKELFLVLDLIDKERKEEAENKLNKIKIDIDKYFLVIKKIPDVIALNERILFPLMNELKTNYNDMKKQKYLFQGLNLDIKIERLNNEINEIKDLTDKFLLDDIEDKAFIIRKKIEEIQQILYKEYIAKDEVIKLLSNLNKKINTIRFEKEKISQNWNKLSKRYQLNKDDTKKIEEFCSQVLSLETKMVIFNNQYEKNQEANVVLLHKLKEFDKKLKEIQYIHSKLCLLENKVKEDEIYINEQYKQLKYIYHRACRKIEKLPKETLGDLYLQKKMEAISSLNEIYKKINEDILNVKELTQLIEDSQHIIIRFYKDTNMIIKAAIFVEKAIIYTNRYRTNKFINRQLARAEYLYKHGEYEDSLDTCLVTLETVEPGIYDKLLKEYEKSLLATEEEIKDSNLL